MNKLINSKKKRIIVVISLAIILLLISFLYYKIYSLYHIGIPCIFFEITGLYCPGCGITRAYFSLIKLDIISALHNNLLIFIISPFLIYYCCKMIINWVNQKEEKQILPNWLCNVLLIITLLFGILRNIDLFDFLKPLI